MPNNSQSDTDKRASRAALRTRILASRILGTDFETPNWNPACVSLRPQGKLSLLTLTAFDMNA